MTEHLKLILKHIFAYLSVEQILLAMEVSYINLPDFDNKPLN